MEENKNVTSEQVLAWAGKADMFANNFNPFLPSQFFIIAVFSISAIVYNLKTLITCCLRFFSLLYLSSMYQLYVGCFIMDPPIFGPMLCLASICSFACSCSIFYILLIFLFAACLVCFCLLSLPFMRLPILSLPNVSCLHLPI